jgi:glycyl-tRNA synthetase beta chain
MDLVVEIGTEELPARVIKPLLDYLRDRFSSLLGREDIETYGTPRRLALYIRNFEDRRERVEEIVYGPPWKVSFDREGKPTKALEGFLRKHGASLSEVFKARRGEGEYAAVRKVYGEVSSLEKLKENFEEILLSAPLPKRMRWTSSRRITFSRPIRWILALHGDRVVDLSFGEVRSGRRTYGHRILSSGPLELERAEDYLKVLEENFVIPDMEKRKRLILEEVKRAAEGVGGSPEYPEGLVEEVTNLVEFPFPVVGTFEERFLELPERVIVTVAAHHQRFFCVKREGRLTNHFIGISNNRPQDDSIRRGYERVLKARLEDALFFYREDLKRGLESLVPKLEGVLEHPKIGTVLDKVERLKKVCLRICDILRLPETTRRKVLRSAHLSKADLLTEMVREFDELQGYMGYVYALKQGEEEEVALALWEQYKPSGSEGETPGTVTGAVLSLGDKIDTLISFFSAGEIPRGGSDPYGLRRSAFGIFRILEDRGWGVNLEDLLDLYPGAENLGDLRDFLAQRLESYLGAQDLVRAVVSVLSPLNPYGVIRRVRELQRLRDTDLMKDVCEAYRRVVKIIPKGWEKAEVEEELLTEKEEKDLWKRVRELETKGSLSLEDLGSLKPYVDSLFERVLIMDKDPKVRNNRLALLFRTKKVFNRVADFSLVVP